MSNSKVREVKIKDHTYAIELLPASQGFTVAMDIIKTFLPAIGAWADGARREEYIMPEEDNLFSEVSMLLVTQSDRLDIPNIVSILLRNSCKDGQVIDFDTEFAANYSTLIQLLEFALRENFGDFFTGYLKDKGFEIPSLGAKMSRTETTTE